MCLAIPGKLEERFGDDPLTPMGKVRFGGIAKDICLAFVPNAKVGDYVLVHVGMAISVIDEEEAQHVYGYLSEMGVLEELEGSSPEPADGFTETGESSS
jgi:hydrogenase expression/formation protein HypC